MRASPSTVLVTGSSSGFGELIVKTLAQDGHRVFATMRSAGDRNREAAEQLQQWATAHQARLEVVELDVTSDHSVATAMEYALTAAGTIDVVVNNAGASAAGPLEAFSLEQMAALLNLNALGPMRVSKAVLPSMRAAGSGLIVWITSTLGRVLPGRGGLYPATKWAAEGFAESLRHQVAPFGIDVAILEPGSFPTPATFKSMIADDQDVTAAYAAVASQTSANRQAYTRAEGTGPADPAYRLPDPQEVAEAVKQLIELPAGRRPLRTVVGPVYTEGVAEYNQTYAALRAHLEEVLRRPDQAITWTPRPA